MSFIIGRATRGEVELMVIDLARVKIVLRLQDGTVAEVVVLVSELRVVSDRVPDWHDEE
jgi:hypothetical protein